MGFLKSILPEGLYNKFIKPVVINIIEAAGVKSYSQEGEDLILLHHFANKKGGFFIDVGAHHPKRFSNTYLLSKKGWTGINIEPNPDLFRFFLSGRKQDINLNFGISEKEQTLIYYSFSEPAFNTFSKESADRLLQAHPPPAVLKSKMEIKTIPLSQLFSQYVNNRTVDLLMVDVEGLDYEVLLSNNWAEYKPAVVLVENGIRDLTKINEDPVSKLLISNGYRPFAKTNNNIFFELAI